MDYNQDIFFKMQQQQMPGKQPFYMTNPIQNLYMTESTPGGKSSNQRASNLAYIEPVQVMHYGGGTWRMVTR